MTNIQPVPHFSIYAKNGSNGIYKPVGSTNVKFESRKEKIMGITNASLKFGSGFVTCKFEFPLHQNAIQAVTLGQDGDLVEMFDFASYWRLEYGWAGGGRYLLSDMKIFDLSLNYDQDSRSFNISMSVVPGPIFVLGDITLSMLGAETIKELRTIDSATNLDLLGSETWGNHLSIGSILTRILFRCKEILDYDDKKAKLSSVKFSKDQKKAFGYDADGNPQINQQAFSDLGDVYTSTYTTHVSDRVKYGTSADVPTPSDIRLLLFGSTNFSNEADLQMETVAESFNGDAMENKDTLAKIQTAKYFDTSVLQFINGILSDNGFDLMPSPHTIGSDGKIEWMIIQTDFTGLGAGVVEEEFVGIDVLSKPFGGKSKNGKFINTIGKDSEIFDLHSNRNVVLSVNASTEAGRSTYTQSLATENLVTDIGNTTKENTRRNSGDGEDNPSPLETYRRSMFGLIANQSHEINLDTIGIPNLKISDNIHVYLAGKLFGGKYKIVELEHTFGAGEFKSNIRAIRLVEPLTNTNSTMDQYITPEIPEYLRSTKESRDKDRELNRQDDINHQQDIDETKQQFGLGSIRGGN